MSDKNNDSFLGETTVSVKHKKRVPVWCLVASVISAIVLGVLGTVGILMLSPIGKINLKLGEINLIVKHNFLGEVDYTRLDETVLSGYIKGLDDKYGFYKGVEDTKDVDNSFKGIREGIGAYILYTEELKAFQIYRLDSGGPADTAGLKAGDKILSIDGKTIEDLGYEKAVNAFKKPVGETAECEIERNGNKFKVNIVYKEFVQQSVYYREIDEYGYICFTDFADATVKQFKNAIDFLLKKNVKGLIFDLRDNGGGTVDSVCSILDTLVGKCDLMTVKYANGEKKVLKKSDKNEIDLPMTVLTNGATASASELFAATIRDMNKGKLIGGTTYGKGVMQRTYKLIDGSSVRITVADFFPAGGESFNGVGLAPDYSVEFTEWEKSNKYFLGDNDSYIKKALEVLKDGK